MKNVFHSQADPGSLEGVTGPKGGQELNIEAGADHYLAPPIGAAVSTFSGVLHSWLTDLVKTVFWVDKTSTDMAEVLRS